MSDFADHPYLETCAECDSWDLKLDNIIFSEEESRWEFNVTCRECSSEWKDWIDED